MLKTVFFLFVVSLIPSVVFTQSGESLLSQKATSFDEISELSELADLITNERLVLLGEASHGTSEFYTKRAFLSKHLTEERDFDFIAVEGDWASLSRINEFVKHKESGPATIEEALENVVRWPLWMWRNHEFKELVEWLHSYNASLPMNERVGLYGIDVRHHDAALYDVVEWLSSVVYGGGGRSARFCPVLHRLAA